MKEDKISRHSGTISLFIGLIFVSHPVQTEAVTYVWQRTASMAAMFYLASLCFYVKFRLLQESAVPIKGKQLSKKIATPPKNPRQDITKIFYYSCSLMTALAAMFTKEMTVTLPLIILLYEFSFLKTKKNINWKYVVPFLLALFMIALTVLLLPKSIRAQEMEGVISGVNFISPSHYLFTQFRVIVTYIRLVFVPVHQNLDYGFPIFQNILDWPVWTSLLFLIAILYAAKRLFLRYRLVSFSIFWFFLTLLPESSVVPLKDVIFEHRLYLPLAGYSIFLVSGAYYLFGKKSFIAMALVLTMIIGCNSYLTYQRNKVWKDEFSLWDDTVKKSPHKARPHYNRGNIFAHQGLFTQAMSDYDQAIAIDPQYADAYNNRGLTYDKQGHPAQALADYNKSIAINPKNSEVYTNRGIVDDKFNNFTQALSDYDKAIELDPNNAEAYTDRGAVYAKQNNITQAMDDFAHALAIDPQYSAAYSNRGLLYDILKNYTQAISDYTKAIAINPQFILAYNNRAIAYYHLKEYDAAWADVHQAEALGAAVNPALINALKQVSGRDR